jgi:hypothetical protein
LEHDEIAVSKQRRNEDFWWNVSLVIMGGVRMGAGEAYSQNAFVVMKLNRWEMYV